MKRTYCTVANLNVTDGKELPEWYLLFKEGVGELADGTKYRVDREGFNAISARIETRGIDVVFDYEHQTLEHTEAPAAGWCKDWRYVDGEGVLAKVDWTDKASSYLLKREYRYFSPVFFVSKEDGRIKGVHSVALTNSPKTNHLQPLLAKLGAELPNERNNKENSMDLLKLLISALKLNEDADEKAVVAAVKDLLGKDSGKKIEVVPEAVVAALGVDTNDESTVVASIYALKQKDKSSVSLQEFNDLKESLTKRDAEEIVAKAMAEGKITPDQKEWADDYATRDLKGFQVFVSKASVVVPLTRLPDGDLKRDQQNLDEATLAVAKMMGIEQDDLKTYGGKGSSI